MKLHKISVTVEKDSIRVVPDTIRMYQADELTWLGSNERKFTIQFDGPSPFQHRQIRHELALSRHQPRSLGQFKYTVISVENPALRLDPVIIVDPPPTPVEP